MDQQNTQAQETQPSLPDLIVYYDHVLTEEEMETVTDTLIQSHDDPELLIHFSAIREDNGFYETTALVFLSPKDDEVNS